MNRDLSSIQSGFDVIGSDGKKIGTVKECTESYCHIDTGFLGLGPDYFIPLDAFSQVGDRQVHLNVPSDQIDQMGWDRPRETESDESFAGRSRMYETEEAPREEQGVTQDTSRAIPLAEEELRARKERNVAGEVEVSKDVVEEQRNLEVPVSHEEAIIRQRSVDRPSDQPIGEGETIRIPLSEEQVTAEKETHVYGEVDVEKRNVTEQRRFQETVRKEVPRVTKEGHVENFVDDESDRPATRDRASEDVNYRESRRPLDEDTDQ